jgi:glc operon protein GlcG
MRKLQTLAVATILLASAFPAVAQQQPAPAAPPAPPPPYGAPIGLEVARKAMAAAEAEATKNNWSVTIAILDSTGHLVMLHRPDTVSYATIRIAQDKAQTAVDFRRPSKAFQDLLAAGGEGLRILGIHGLTPLEGGVPIVADGKLIGGIGASGATSAQDAQVAKAGADAVSAK